MNHSPRIVALIVAAGVGRRAGGDVPKQYAPIAGKPLLRYAVEALATHPAISAVQVVIHPQHAAMYAAAIGDKAGGWRLEAGNKLAAPIHGGSERSDSVGAGLKVLAEGGIAPYASLTPSATRLAQSATRDTSNLPDYVLIHDAARPFLSHGMIDRIIEKLDGHTAVLPALAVADTLRKFDGEHWSDVSRDQLFRIQTPQAFPFRRLLKIIEGGRNFHLPSRQDASSAMLKAAPPSVFGLSSAASGSPSATGDPSNTTLSLTDDAALWLAAGGKLVYVQGEENLRKVTTGADMAWAEQAATGRIAVGMGYDVHQLIDADASGVIRIGGVDIPFTHKLLGHSDADVLLHAITDALLGTIADGDIGMHFKPTDERWKGTDSKTFLAEAARRVRAVGGVIHHVDATVICELPKIGPHRDAMREVIAQLLGISLAQVSVKATTTECLGFTGRREGIAAQAVATVALPVAA